MTNYDEIEAMLMSEAFDEDSTYSLPVINLNPKQTPAQTLAIQTPSDEGSEKVSALVVKLASASELGEKIVNLKMSDKTMQVILFSLSDKGNFAELKNGLGGDPFAAINTIIEIIKERVKEQRLESVMLRFPTKKMKGRGPQVQRIVSMIAKRRLPTFESLDEIKDVSSKHSYVVLYKKSTGLESKGLPTPNPERFEKVETKIGDTYVDTTTGKAASKAEAIAVTIADKVDKTVNDKALVAKLKVSRRAALLAQGTGQFKPADHITASNLKKLDSFMMAPPTFAPDEVPDRDIVNMKEKATGELKENVKIFMGQRRAIDDWHAEHMKENNGKFSSFDINGPHGAFTGVYGNTLIDMGLKGNALKTEIVGITSKLDDELLKLNANNVDEVLKNCLYEISTTTAYKTANPQMRHRLLSYFTGAVSGRIIERAFMSTYYNLPNVSDQFKPGQRQAIKSYCGNYYKQINDFLLGRADPTATTLKHVKDLDSAFEIGATLPKGTTLYRGQKLSKNEVTNAAETKLFYFRNFVSTSLKPIIFQNGFSAEVVGSYDAEAPSTDNFAVSDVVQAGYSSTGVNFSDSTPNQSIGFIIRGAEVTKVIVPSGLTGMPRECEVLLPRGTVLRVNRMTGSGGIADDRKTYLADCTVVAPDQIDETTELYDGDLFMSEGIVEPIKKGGFFAEMYNSSKEERNNEGWELLSSVVNLSETPEKFIL